MKMLENCDYCNPYPVRYFNKEKNKVWVNQDKLLELIDDLTVNYNADNLKRKGYVNAELLKKTIKGVKK